MRLTITMQMDNAAFEDNPHEAAYILHELAARFEDDGEPAYPIKLRDLNGNTVGVCKKDEDD